MPLMCWTGQIFKLIEDLWHYLKRRLVSYKTILVMVVSLRLEATWENVDDQYLVCHHNIWSQ
jgi:hypothetical protein